MTVRLFIGNLPYSASEADLRSFFSAVGEPTHVLLPVDRETGRPRGFAFVDFADRETAEEVIRRLDGQLMQGRPVAVSEARAREDRPAGPRAGPGGPRPGPAGPRPGFGGGPPRGGGMTAPPPRDRPAPSRRERSSGGGGKSRAPWASERPRGPIKFRPVGRLYDEDEDLSADQQGLDDFDDPATSQPDDPATSQPNDEDEGDDQGR